MDGIRRFRTGVLAALVAIAAPTSARAEVPDNPSEACAVTLGRVRLFPLFSSSVERTDNLFMRSGDIPGSIRSATIKTLSPGLIADLPFSHSHARVGYALRYRDYGTAELRPGTSHYLVADSRLLFGSGFVLGFKDDFQRGVLDTQVFDPGGDITFEGERFEWNLAQLELGLERGVRKKLSLVVASETNRVVGTRISSLPDVNKRRVGVSGEQQFRAGAWATWEMVGGSSDYTRPAADGEERQRESDLSGRIGVRMQVGPKTTWAMKVGWARNRFESRNSSTFNGWVGRFDHYRTLPRWGWFDVGFTREIYPVLTFAGANYYVSDQFRILGANSTATKIALGGHLIYYSNHYPDEVQGRTDRTLDGEFWAGYRFHEWMEWRVFVHHSSRSSAASGYNYDYTASRFGTTLRMGF